MPKSSMTGEWEAAGDEGCAYPLAECRSCGAPRRDGSSYCRDHHALCYIRLGSRAESRWLRQFESLACAVGGRRAHDAAEPPQRFLERLERLARILS